MHAPFLPPAPHNSALPRCTPQHDNMPALAPRPFVPCGAARHNQPSASIGIHASLGSCPRPCNALYSRPQLRTAALPASASVADAVVVASRREALLGLAGLALLAQDMPAYAAGAKEVGGYLPGYGVEDFVKFVPPPAKTPVRRGADRGAWAVARELTQMDPYGRRARGANHSIGFSSSPRQSRAVYCVDHPSPVHAVPAGAACGDGGPQAALHLCPAAQRGGGQGQQHAVRQLLPTALRRALVSCRSKGGTRSPSPGPAAIQAVQCCSKHGSSMHLLCG